MLDQNFHKQDVLARLRGGVLGDVLDPFASDLRERGHAGRTIREYLRGAGHFAHWLERSGVPVAAVSEATTARFLEEHQGPCECNVPVGTARHVRASLPHLLVTLRNRGLIAPPHCLEPSDIDCRVSAFVTHSRQCRGLRPATLRQYSLYAREFLGARFGVGRVEPGAITGEDVRNFVAARARRTPGLTAQAVACALRAFLRFVVLQGECDSTLVDAVPSVASHRARLPRGLTEEQVVSLLGSFDRSTALGRRGYAIALCLARLGLRIGEVVGLRMQDVDWRRATLLLATSKSRRASELPLPSDVGDAIVEYLRDGRPATTDRHIFVTHATPRGRGLSRIGACNVIRRAFERVGIEAPSKGPHALRHTLATRLVANGASLKQVADVLRHRSLDSTFIYTRVDLPSLRSVAMPWPEVP